MADSKAAADKAASDKAVPDAAEQEQGGVFTGLRRGPGPKPGDGSESGTPVNAVGDAPVPVDGVEAEHVLTLAKQLDAWIEAYGEDAVARAVALSESNQADREAEADKAARANAAQARAQGGQQTPPQGRQTPAERASKA